MALITVCCGLAVLTLVDAARIQMDADDGNGGLEVERRTGKLSAATQLVIWADYDGCFDIISPLNTNAQAIFDHKKQLWADKLPDGQPYKTNEELQQMLKGKLKEISKDYESVNLFIGSIRQGQAFEHVNEQNNNNGNSMSGLAALAAELNEETDGNPPWKFNKAILETEDDWDQDKIIQLGKTGGSPAMKKAMAVNLYKHVRTDVDSSGPVDVIFFDHKPDYLVDVASVPIPVGISLYLAHFNHLTIAFQQDQLITRGPFTSKDRKGGKDWVKISDFQV